MEKNHPMSESYLKYCVKKRKQNRNGEKKTVRVVKAVQQVHKGFLYFSVLFHIDLSYICLYIHISYACTHAYVYTNTQVLSSP